MGTPRRANDTSIGGSLRMSNVVPAKKGVHCLLCGGTRFRQVSHYRPLRSVKYVYARCKNPACCARIKFKVTLVYSLPDDNPSR